MKIKNIIAGIALSATLVGGIGLVLSQDSSQSVQAYDSRLHIVGSGTFGSWDTSHAVQLQDGGSDNVGQRTGLTIAKDSEFKIAYIDGGSIQWGWDNYGSGAMDNKSYTFAQDKSGNILIKYDGKYNIFLTNAYKVYMSRDLTITFNPNSGTVSPTSKTVTQSYNGDSINKYGDLPTPTREGYSFTGWYTESSGGTQITSTSSTYSLTANQTLYAHWALYPKVTKYAVVDGVKQSTPIGSDSVPTGQTYAVPEKIYRPNCTFVGWYTNEACTSSYTARTIPSDMSIYAKYTTTGSYSGTISVDLKNSGWANAAANYAISFMDKTTYGSEIVEWSSYVTGTTKDECLVSIPFEIGFNPKQIIVVRYNSSYSESSWNSNKWSSVWNQSPDTDLTNIPSVIRVGDSTDGQGHNYIYFGSPKVTTWNPTSSDIFLEGIKMNGSKHVEYYSTSVNLAANQEFKIQIAPYASGDYYGTYSTHDSLKNNFSGGGSSNILAKVAGTYAFYFDSYNGSLYITKVEIAEADEWAQYFLANVGCDSTGRNLPSGWSTCATEYGKLSGAAKDIVYGATASEGGTYVEQAVARYDVAVRNHPSLTKFIVNSGDTPRSAAIANVPSIFRSSETSNTILIVVIFSSIALTSIGGYFFLRHRKEN